VKITDFGIAHAAGSAPVTRTGMLIGTPGYLAPERVSGAPATPASDIYSLGVVAFECLTGKPPFAGTGIEVALAHRDRPLPLLPPDLPGDITALVGAMTAKDPAARPATAGQVAQQASLLRDALAAGTLHGGYGASANGGAGYGLLTDGGPPFSPDRAWAGFGGGPDDGAGSQTLTLAGAQGAAAGPLPHGAGGRGWSTRALLSGIAAVAVAAGLIGWLLASTLGGSAPSSAASQPPPRTAAASHVSVSASALEGLPLKNVRQQLHDLGLGVRVVQVPSEGQPPGTVITVNPHGRVRTGSTVNVLVAASPHGHGDHGQGNGDHGHGGGPGDGGGNGGGDGGG
jgi:serine/threonine-protein kinase